MPAHVRSTRDGFREHRPVRERREVGVAERICLTAQSATVVLVTGRAIADPLLLAQTGVRVRNRTLPRWRNARDLPGGVQADARQSPDHGCREHIPIAVVGVAHTRHQETLIPGTVAGETEYNGRREMEQWNFATPDVAKFQPRGQMSRRTSERPVLTQQLTPLSHQS